jgi:hypothetical protein
MSELYDEDIVLWSERQAELLRRRAAGEIVNDTDLDWSNIAEEIEDVGRSELRATKSLLEQAMAHLLKIQAWPEAGASRGWRREIRAFLLKAREDATPAMRNRIDLERSFQIARLLVPEEIDGVPHPSLPEACPWILDQLLSDDLDAMVDGHVT